MSDTTSAVPTGMPYRSNEVDERNKWTTRFKYFLYFFNVVSLVLAIVVMTMAIYIRADWTIKHYIYELEAYLMWTGPYILMASCSFTIVISALGCWATVYENPFLLTAFTMATGATALIGLGGVAYSLNHGITFSDITPWLTDRFTYLVFESDTDPRSARIVRIMQEELGCCGGSGWQDYANYNMEIPYECRNPVTGNMYVYGCGIIFSDFMEPLVAWMSGIALLLIVLQIMAMVAAMILRRNFKREDKLISGHQKSATYTAVRSRNI